MAQRIAIAFGAGLAAALLFVVSAKGTMFAMLLAYFAPLPVMIAALGWGHASGLIAAVVGAVVIALGVDPVLGLIFGIAFGAAGWWLAYLSLLAQTDETGAVIWYPVGRIAVWTIIVSGAMAGAIVISLAVRFGSFEAAIDQFAERSGPALLRMIGAGARLSAAEATELARVMMRIMPVAAAASALLMLSVNLYAAGRVVLLSQRLPRPWPDVARVYILPRQLLGAFAAALVGSFFGGLFGAFAWIAVAAIGMAYALQGFATAHVLTRDWPQRRAALFALYGVNLMLTPWPLLLVALLGIADALFSLRASRPEAPRLPPNTNKE